MRVIIRNDFHDKDCALNYDHKKGITKAQLLKIKRLCPYKDCKCWHSSASGPSVFFGKGWSIEAKEKFTEELYG